MSLTGRGIIKGLTSCHFSNADRSCLPRIDVIILRNRLIAKDFQLTNLLLNQLSIQISDIRSFEQVLLLRLCQS